MRRRSDDRGAVAMFLSVTVTLLVLMASFAVDLGMQRVARRDMQGLADLVALDLARLMDGTSTTAELMPEIDTDDPTSALSMALARNDETFGAAPALDVAWGSWDGTTFDTTADPPSAVRVVAATSVDFLFSSGEGATSRTAYAVSTTSACHRLGSFAAALDSGDVALLAPLNDLLGLNLSLLSYQGLAGVELSLGDLAATGLVGTENELVTSAVSLADLVDAAVAVLNEEQPTGFDVAVAALGAFTDLAGTVPQVALGDTLSVAPGDAAAMEADFSVLDVLAGAVAVANGSHAVSIPNLQAGVPGLGNQFEGSLMIQTPAQAACGSPNSSQARAANSQLSGVIDLEFVNLPTIQLDQELDLGLVKGTLQTGRATGDITIDLGNAQSQLVSPPDVHCSTGPGDPSQMTVSVSSGVATYAINTSVDLAGQIRVAGVKVDVEATVSIGLAAPGPAGGSTVTLSLPPNDETPVETGTDPHTLQLAETTVDSITATESLTGLSLGLSGLLGIENAILDVMLTDANGFLNKALAPLAANVDTMLVGPLVDLLGLRIGGADMFALSASCNTPALRG